MSIFLKKELKEQKMIRAVRRPQVLRPDDFVLANVEKNWVCVIIDSSNSAKFYSPITEVFFFLTY